jgi:tRNA (guanine-N7-)-methyltransferase
MPHLYTTPPVLFPGETWKHDREDITLIQILASGERFYVKVKNIHDSLHRISLLATPIDLIFNHHKRVLQTAAEQIKTQILKSNLGNPWKPDIGLGYLLNEEKLFSFNWDMKRTAVFEIGSGNGSFLCEHALQNPDVIHIGTEINGFILRKSLRKSARAQLRNIYFIRNDARYLLNYHIPETSLEKIFINFPDPWEKTRYLKRRLTQPETLTNFARVLKTGGEVHFTTDHREYADFTRKQFSRSLYFNLLKETENARLPYATKYERKWQTEGRRIIQLIFKRNNRYYLPLEPNDQFFPNSFEIETGADISSGDILKDRDFFVVFKDVYKGSDYDILDTIINYRRYQWDILLLKTHRHLVFDANLNHKYLTKKTRRFLESLFEQN